MKKFFIFSFVYFIYVFNFLNISNIYAQDFLYENFTVKYSPTNIREGELVKFYIVSEDFNLSQSLITWYINGEKKDEGFGRTNFEANAGKVGKSIIVKVNVKNDIFEESKNITITPNTTFILYEGADSYIPPFYKGRALPSKEGEVRMAAISFQNSEISDFNTKKNNYKWSVNDKDVLNKANENQIVNKVVSTFMDNSLNIKVRKEDLSGGKISDSISTVFIQDVEPIIYKTDITKTIKNEAKTSEKGNDIYFFVEPFFFSGSSRYDNNIVYEWKIDGVVTNTKKPWFIKVNGIKDKVSEISLKITQAKKITQDFQKNFKLIFE